MNGELGSAMQKFWLRYGTQLMQAFGLGVGVLLLFDLLSALLAERVWFESVGYFSVLNSGSVS